jgi:hypothetical protein
MLAALDRQHGDATVQFRVNNRGALDVSDVDVEL